MAVMIFVSVSFVATGTAELDRLGSLPGFDREARNYIREQANLRQATRDFADWPDQGGGKQNRVFQWLMPFCTDLRPYEQDYSEEADAGWIRFRYAYLAIQLIRREWLPDGWTDESVRLQNPWPAKGFHGKISSFWKVPNFIVPVFSSPSGAPVIFTAWQLRSREGVTFTILSAWKFNVVVLHRDGGFGNDPVTNESLAVLRDHYFRFPPSGVFAPEGWGSEVEIARADGRFVSGRMWSTLKGQRPKIPRRVTWEWASDFFFDGSNFAFVVSTWSRSGAETFPALADPLDIDWTLPEYQR